MQKLLCESDRTDNKAGVEVLCYILLYLCTPRNTGIGAWILVGPAAIPDSVSAVQQDGSF